MALNKTKLLKITLIGGALFLGVGATVHFFGLTLFPFYEAILYRPYQDSLLALSCVILAMFMISIARDPIRNIDTLKVVIIGSILATIFDVAIIYKVDFVAIGSPMKKTETLVEAGLGLIFIIFLLWSYPYDKKR